MKIISENPSPGNPDARIELPDSSGSVTLWWRETPVLDGTRVGAIDGFSASSSAAAQTLLDEAAERLREAGCRIAVGPMDGNTWRTHRFVVESDGRGPFLMEPRNPPEYPAWWRAAGFSELSRYSSSAVPLDGMATVSPALQARLARSVTVEPLDSTRFDEELDRIYQVSLASFAGNFLYTPLEREAFLAAYQKLRDRIDPDLVRIARRGGEPCGFVFGMPDLEAVARGEKPALIVKTLAVDPASRCAGLGSLLVDELHRIGREKGYTEAIHALQHETNTSLKITGRHHGGAFRRDALFSRLL